MFEIRVFFRKRLPRPADQLRHTTKRVKLFGVITQKLIIRLYSLIEADEEAVIIILQFVSVHME